MTRRRGPPLLEESKFVFQNGQKSGRDSSFFRKSPAQMKADGSNGLLYLRPSNELLGLRHQKAQNWGRNAFLVLLLPPFRKKRSGGEYVQLARRFGKSPSNMLWLGRRIQRGVLGKSAMIAPTLSPSRHDQE